MDLRTVSDIIRLSKSDLLSTDFEGFLELALNCLAHEVDVDFASFWFHDKESENYSCIRNFCQETDKFETQNLTIKGENYYELFPILQTSEIIQKVDTTNHDWNLPQLGTLIHSEANSWIALPLKIRDNQFGFLLVASKNRRVYDVEDQNALCCLGLLIKESYRDNFNTNPKPEQVEGLPVVESGKLDDLIFYTAHNLRHPITNLLSLVELAKSMKDEDGLDEIFSLMKIEALKLDDVIRIMIAKIEHDEHKI